MNFADLELLWSNSIQSTSRVTVGVLLAVVAGVAAGLVRSALPVRVQQNFLLKFALEAPRFPPPIAWIPFVILAFGVGDVAAYAIVFLGAFPPIFTATYDGARSIPPAQRRSARSLEPSRFARLFRFELMACLPQILTGIRIGSAMGWMAVIAAEMISGQSGLGYSIQMNRLYLQYPLMILDMCAIGAIGFVLHEGLLFLERYLVPWGNQEQLRSLERLV